VNASILPKALMRKEWYQQRWYALFVLLLISPSVLMLPWKAIPMEQRTDTMLGRNGWPTLHAQLQFNFEGYISFTHTDATTGLWASFVVIGLAVMGFYVERKNHSFWFTLTSPTSRRQLLRVKFVFGTSVVIAVFSVLALYLTVLAAFGQLHHFEADILYWWFAEVTVQLAMYSIAFLLCVVVGNPIVAGVLAYIAARVPDVIMLLAPNGLFRHRYSWVVVWIFRRLSPLNQFGAGWNKGMLPYLVWSLVLAFLCYLVAQRLFQHVELENVYNLFVFPRTQKWGIVIFSLLVGFMIVEEIVFRQSSRVLKIALFITISGLLLMWLRRLFETPSSENSGRSTPHHGG